MTHAEVQQTAKNTVEVLCQSIRPGITEGELVHLAEESLRSQGITRYWYHQLPALLFVGERTLLSQGAPEYTPTDTAVGQNDIITVDLSPEADGLWGDYARTIIVENGRVTSPGQVKDPAFREGLQAEERLHAFLVENARPGMTFSRLHSMVEGYLGQLGYRNLDFLGNFGHSIVDGVNSDHFYELVNDPRVFFDAHNHMRLGDVELFTFEPHIAKAKGQWGFKREDIYRFENGCLKAI